LNAIYLTPNDFVDLAKKDPCLVEKKIIFFILFVRRTFDMIIFSLYVLFFLSSQQLLISNSKVLVGLSFNLPSTP
jgi:hypothetical protein